VREGSGLSGLSGVRYKPDTPAIAATISMVDIHLIVNGSSIHFLSIPNDDIEYLSIRPLKWLSFVMFCICGAHGDIFTRLDGPLVDYDSASLTEDGYYYKPYPEGI